jgi:type II secretion system protein D
MKNLLPSIPAIVRAHFHATCCVVCTIALSSVVATARGQLPNVGSPRTGSSNAGSQMAGTRAPGSSDTNVTYAPRFAAAADISRRLEAALRGTAQVVADPSTNRVIVRGGAEAQRIAQLIVAQVDQPPRPVIAPTAAAPAAPAAPQQHTSAMLRASQQHGAAQQGAPAPRHLAINWPANEVEPELWRLFGARMSRLAPRRSGDASFLVAARGGRSASLRVDPSGNGLSFSGPEPLVSQVIQLVAAQDASRSPAAGSVRALALQRSDPQKIQRAIEIYRRSILAAPGDKRLAQVPPPPVPSPPTAGDPNAAAAPGADVTDTEQTNQRLRELGLDLNIEVLPDLDAIILRGSNRDVNEVLRIIEDIERISAEAVPEVEVVELHHASSEALAPLLTTIEPELAAGRPGKVSITALNKPNALLLIGRIETVKAVRDLITKLDQPVAPETLLRVFKLRHAPAAGTSTTVQEFFAKRTGLATRLFVTPDIRSNSLIVQAAPRDMAEVEALLKRIDTPQSASVNLVRVFKLRNSLATNLADSLEAAIQPPRGPGAAAAAGAKSSALELLTIDTQGQKVIKSGILSDVKIVPDVKANSLIVTAPSQSMELVAALIAEMDAAAATVAQIKVFHIVNGDASNLVLMLRTLLSQQGGPGPGNVLPRSRDESAFVPLQYSVDARTNSIIAAGSAGDLAIVEALLLRLDESNVEERKNHVYQLKNAPALDVADAINQFLRTQRAVDLAAPGDMSPFQQIEKEVVVVPEPVGNLLIISASPRYFDEIYKLVEKIDEQPPQVLIQVLIAEVALTEDTQFGVEWGLQDGLLFDRSLLGDLLTTTSTTTFGNPPTTVQQQTIVGATNEPGFAFNSSQIGNSGSAASLATAAQVGKQALANFAVGRSDPDLGFGGLVLSAGSKSVNVLLRALQQNQRLEVLSRPQVMTIDNQPAFIQVGQKVPLITNVIVNQIGQTNTVQMDNVGLILGVTPRISPDGMVVMEIDAEKSEVAPEAEGIPVSISASGAVVRAPRINITTAQTTISTASGETIVLGGLITKRRLTINRRVPYLADVPVLGWMFRYDVFEAQRTELLIILTPHVVRNAADAERLRQIESARMHWCAADVHEIHGDPAFCRRGECPVCNKQMPVVYPDLDPSGISPGQMLNVEELEPGEELVPEEDVEGPLMVPADENVEGTDAANEKRSKWSIARLLPQRAATKAVSSKTESSKELEMPPGTGRAPKAVSIPKRAVEDEFTQK